MPFAKPVPGSILFTFNMGISEVQTSGKYFGKFPLPLRGQ